MYGSLPYGFIQRMNPCRKPLPPPAAFWDMSDLTLTWFLLVTAERIRHEAGMHGGNEGFGLQHHCPRIAQFN
jgi:hypothetical protein